MDYSQTLAYLYERLPMYQRIGAQAFKKDLTNIRLLCEALGHPEQKFTSLHVGGTNGKGSVSSMLSSILMEAGLKTGLYTSPHLRSFTERIRIDGDPISQEKVVSFVADNQALLESVKPSFFEVTVAMAFDHFAQEAVDVGVIEVGLGGRLDSTNIITPALSVITNISYDHQALLGNTLAEIAGEKAGIIKTQVPVVIGETHPETRGIFVQKAEAMQAPITFADQEIEARRVRGDWRYQVIEVKNWPEQGKEAFFELGLIGHYQARNLVTALAAIRVLRKAGWDISEEALQRGLARVRDNTGLLGRMQVLREEPLVLTDVAHNEAGIREVLAQLLQLPHASLHIVWGMVDDKDHAKILALLPKNARYYFVKPEVPRGMDAQQLKSMALAFGLNGEVYSSVAEGIKAMLPHAGPGSLGFVGGSTFVVAEIPEPL